MKIGIIAEPNVGVYSSWGENLFTKLKSHGYSCIDYQMADTDSLLYTAAEDEMYKILAKQKKLAAEAGIEVSQVHGPWRLPQDYTEEDRRERMEKMKKSIQMTAALGCKNWVIHPIMPFGINERGTEDANKTWDINLSFMSELLKFAKAYDITICLENMPFVDFSISKPCEILKFVRSIDDDNFKICLDTGHVATFQELSLGDAVRELGSEIRALHVHDSYPDMDLHLMPYAGVIDWSDFAKALGEIGYAGVFSLETTPSVKLSERLFDEMNLMLAKIAKEIVCNI